MLYLTHRTRSASKALELYKWYKKRGFTVRGMTKIDRINRKWLVLYVYRSRRDHENVIADHGNVICL